MCEYADVRMILKVISKIIRTFSYLHIRKSDYVGRI